MRIVITGICGFVGSSLALALVERLTGVEIIGIDSLIRPGSELNRQRLKSAGVTVRHGDIRAASDFEALPTADWIIDAAANASVLAGVDGRTSSRQLVEHNLVGTINVLEYARRAGAGLALLSTSRVYSIPALVAVPLRVEDDAFVFDATTDSNAAAPTGCSSAGVAENFSTAAPISLYGASKLASEVMALEYGQSFDFPVVINRCGVMAGAGQFGVAEQGIFSYWIRSHALRRPLRYLGFGGHGHQVRDALAPEDLAELLIKQFAAPVTSGGQIWNVAGGAANALSLAQLSRYCEAEFGPHQVVADGSPRPFDVPWVVLDSARASEAFDWRPQQKIHDILAAIAKHHRQHPQWLDVSTQ
jgi:CDP-paratose 2-epimerase